MGLLVLFALAVLVGAHCSGDLNDASLDSLEAGENVDYPSYRDFDASLVEECGEHEEYSECSGDPSCRKTCENADRWRTTACAGTKICIRGCVCEDGYARDDRDVCVRETDCPRARGVNSAN
ncbi:PREDICTED: inducible metalloproteinase inhibitor protein-like [Vollenhovia emeryi]|uniref:inducible metalloproteinase inhibitor protein-like n=1 Tax=Vollenhovia emeryi TaxID=411798 RepID=UPI0005F49AE0|nr:PREDICTED: inducible metalloproteinase inhibitor protein-like [Vollenhovia emeryi]